MGIVLTLAEEFTAQGVSQVDPSATGLGIAGVIPAFNCGVDVRRAR